MAQQSCLFIINPISGGIDKAKFKEIAGRKCKSLEFDADYYYTTGKNDNKKIQAIIHHCKPGRVIACGGDGTINLVAQTILGNSISLGIIPMGSANGLATELGIAKNIEQSLAVSLAEKRKYIDAIHINNKSYCFHLCDMGFNAQMIKEFEESNERGMIAYGKAFFRSLAEKRANSYSLVVDGEKHEVMADMIVIANASKYGTGAVISPVSRLDDGTFELVVFKPIPMSSLLSITLSSFLGSIQHSPYVDIYRAKQARITCQHEELMQVDGELLGKVNDVSIQIKHNAIQVFIP